MIGPRFGVLLNLLIFNQWVIGHGGSTFPVRIRTRYGHRTKMADPSDRPSPELLDFVGFSGATRRIRTDDLLITNKPEPSNTPNDHNTSLTRSRKSGG